MFVLSSTSVAAAASLHLPATASTTPTSSLRKRVGDCFYWTTLASGLLLGAGAGTFAGATLAGYRLGRYPSYEEPINPHAFLALSTGGAFAGGFAGLELADELANIILGRG